MLQTTMTLRTIDGVSIPFQNGRPVPSFEEQNRTVLSLNGEWMKRRLAMDHSFSLAPRGEQWLRELEEKEGDYVRGIAAEQWEVHTVPMPENQLSGAAEAKAAETYEDGVWYRRKVVIEHLDSSLVYTFKSLGISYIADLWVNGSWIGYHEGGFTPFALDVTAALREGENDIRIRVDNPPWGSCIDTIPAVAGTDFFNYTGIIQDLWIEGTPLASIVRADIVPMDTNGRLQVTVVLMNQGPAPAYVCLDGSLHEADPQSDHFLASPLASTIADIPAVTDRAIHNMLTLQPGQVRAVRFEIMVLKPKLWSAWQPNLYVAAFTLTAWQVGKNETQDTFCTQFGIRTIRTRGTQLELNGSPLFLAGIARHEEWPDTGRTASWDRILADLEQIRAMNANMVRTGHYPNHLHTYVLLDRLGLLAMSEIPLWQFETAHYEAQNEKRLADQMWREMVFSQYNRPSVIMWSTQNESKDVWLRLAYNERLTADLRGSYDDGRLLTQSSAADQPGPHDPSMAPLDVAAWTMYFGIFHGGTYYEGTRDFVEEAHRAYPNKPILNTEFGHWTAGADSEEDKQLTTYQDTMRALMEHAAVSLAGEWRSDGYVAGIDFWIMYDWYVNHNNWIDTFGIFHMNRKTEKQVAAHIRTDYGSITGDSGGVVSRREGVCDE